MSRTNIHVEPLPERSWLLRLFRDGRHYPQPYDEAAVAVEIEPGVAIIKGYAPTRPPLPSDAVAVLAQLRALGIRELVWERFRADGTVHLARLRPRP